jgi:hypothetical protein
MKAHVFTIAQTLTFTNVNPEILSTLGAALETATADFLARKDRYTEYGALAFAKDSQRRAEICAQMLRALELADFN